MGLEDGSNQGGWARNTTDDCRGGREKTENVVDDGLARKQKERTRADAWAFDARTAATRVRSYGAVLTRNADSQMRWDQVYQCKFGSITLDHFSLIPSAFCQRDGSS